MDLEEKNTQNVNTEGQSINTAPLKKGKPPAYSVHQVIENEYGGDDYWMKIGSVWRGKDGYLSGDTIHGRIILKEQKHHHVQNGVIASKHLDDHRTTH